MTSIGTIRCPFGVWVTIAADAGGVSSVGAGDDTMPGDGASVVLELTTTSAGSSAIASNVSFGIAANLNRLTSVSDANVLSPKTSWR